ncbi:hypothetical protein [Limnovirga soli]|uniref:Uncharacterized protein n=1 Tax=Limnovirga soli TaxID=2656915 RepID=A0A8J8JVR1_9BACT|nr:hypothetical protein [Limnovirga soli]NNV54546.1 hypothetical protein [Limnovirga soli]
MSTDKITPQHLKQLNTLVSKRGISKDDKAVMVQGFSDGRCSSSKELLQAEALEMIKHLQTLQPNAAAAAKMRNKVIYYAHEMNWRIDGKIDMPRLDNWCVKYSYLHKKLDYYEYKELPRLITQIEFVYKDYLNNL